MLQRTLHLRWQRDVLKLKRHPTLTSAATVAKLTVGTWAAAEAVEIQNIEKREYEIFMQSPQPSC